MRTGQRVPSSDLDDQLTEIARELGDLHLWDQRNAHRTDPAYIDHQKPVNDRHIARYEAMLAKEES